MCEVRVVVILHWACTLVEEVQPFIYPYLYLQLHVRDIANVLLLNPKKTKSSTEEEATVLKRVMSRREKQLPVLPEGHENMSQTQVT